MAFLEHVNLVFDWRIRWEGASQDGLGYTHHVGSERSYVALYQPTEDAGGVGLRGHIGIVVDDLDALRGKVEAAGNTPHHFADYEPGRRFYFKGPDDLEIEVVEYD